MNLPGESTEIQVEPLTVPQTVPQEVPPEKEPVEV